VARFTFDRLLTLLAFLAIALAAFLMPAQNDTWWHLKAGERIWTTRHILLSDTFSFTASGAFWPNHEWLSQVIFYGIYALGGLPLLTVLCASAVVVAWAIAWRLTPASPRLKFLLVAWVLSAATTAWTVRPQAFSLLLVAVTVWLLVQRRYIWLPPLFVVWANLHGAVLTGLVLVAAACAAAFCETAAGSQEPRLSWRALRSVRSLAATAALCALATLATPLGYHLWLEIHLAKITTMVDQVLDVFYVTDHQGRKIEDPERLAAIEQALVRALAEEVPPTEERAAAG